MVVEDFNDDDKDDGNDLRTRGGGGRLRNRCRTKEDIFSLAVVGECSAAEDKDDNDNGEDDDDDEEEVVTALPKYTQVEIFMDWRNPSRSNSCRTPTWASTSKMCV